MIYDAGKPVVIDEILIYKSILEQSSTIEAGLLEVQGIVHESISSLRLDYKSILRIDNLWIYLNLTKLQLDNNLIENIENIDLLVNLVWLDLSFNNISAIEGLDKLINLSDLALNNNKISRIQNLDNLAKLQTLSIGNNEIASMNELDNLRNLSELRILNLAGNPICKERQYKYYCLAKLEQLRFLDFCAIDEDSKVAAHLEFQISMSLAQKKDELSRACRLEIRRKEHLDKCYKDSHVLQIQSQIDRAVEDDVYWKKLVIFAPLVIPSIVKEFKSKSDKVLVELREFAISKSFERSYLLQNLQDKMQNYILKNEPGDLAQFNVESITTSGDVMFKNLMGAEMLIVEQFEIMIQEFEQELADSSLSSTKITKALFLTLVDLENEMRESMSSSILLKNGIDDTRDSDLSGAELKSITHHRDDIPQILKAYYEQRVTRVTLAENTLNSGVGQDVLTMIQTTKTTEFDRNRKRVTDIGHFLANFLA